MRNNRDWMLWTALSLVGGFAVFIVLTMMRYLCPHCGEAFAVGSKDGVHCGHCGKRDRLNREDQARLKRVRADLSARGVRVKGRGIKFTVHDQLGYVKPFLGIDELERYAISEQGGQCCRYELMRRRITSSMLLGPTDRKTARQLQRLAIGLAVVCATVQMILSISGMYWRFDDPDLAYVLQPIWLLDAALMLCFSYGVYKGQIWAAAGMFLLQVLTMFSICYELERPPTILAGLKLLIYFGAIQALYYLRTQPPVTRSIVTRVN